MVERYRNQGIRAMEDGALDAGIGTISGMRWSRLRTLILDIWDPLVGLDIHCTAMRGEVGSVGKYWVTLDGDTVWEAPQNAAGHARAGASNEAASAITALIRSYLDTPREELLTKEFEGDRWGILDLLRAADRRIGKRKLGEFFGTDPLEPYCSILKRRGIGRAV